MRHAESRIQSACVRVFRLEHRALAGLFFSIPNGLLTSASQARIAVAEGLLKGAADTFLAVPMIHENAQYHGLFIEFKQEDEIWKGGKRTLTRTYQRPEQRTFQAAVTAQGYAYEVVRSVDEFRALTSAYLGGTYRPRVTLSEKGV